MPDDGRILGIDAGERRIGVAISDPGGSFALPLETIVADGRELERLEALIAASRAAQDVLGRPLGAHVLRAGPVEWGK